MIPGQIFRRRLWWAALALSAGCSTRERFVFPVENPGDGDGPSTEITHPASGDTVVTEGDLLIIEGRSFDPDGVDTVYVAVGGVNQGIPPIDGEGQDTVNFSAQLSTIGHSGATVIVQAFGVDLLGQRGSTVSRQIHIE